MIEILLYTRRVWGEKQRATYEALIDRALDRLSRHPRVGQPRDDLFPGCRVLRVEQHILYYHQPDDTAIIVRRVLHARQDASAAVRDPHP